MNIIVTERALFPIRRDKQTGAAYTSMGGGGGSASSSGTGGITTHSALTNLDYATSGHTGFAPIVNPVFTTQITTPVIYGTDAANGDITIRGTSDATKTSSYVLLQDTGGYVGINTTAPLVKLHITQQAITSYPTLGTTTGGFLLSGDNNLYGLYAGLKTDLGDAWMQVMRNDSATAYNLLLQPVGGNVLIGQTSGSQKLCLTGNQVITSGYLNSEELRGNTSFVSGFAGAGYKLEKSGSDYNLTVDNLTVRKSMQIYELQINKISAVNGGLMVSIANGKAYSIDTGNIGNIYDRWVNINFNSFTSSGLEITNAVSSGGTHGAAKIYLNATEYYYPIKSGKIVTLTCTITVISGSAPKIRWFEQPGGEKQDDDLVAGVNTVSYTMSADCSLWVMVQNFGTNGEWSMTNVSFTSNETRIIFDEDTSAAGTGNIIQFAANDYIRAQEWTGHGVGYYLGVVQAVHHSPTLGTAAIVVTHSSGTPWAGADLVQVGSATAGRQSMIYITAADTNNPYIDILDGVTDGDFSGHTKVRLGNLTGITDADLGGALSGYGLYSDNIYLKGKIVASSGKVGGFTITANELYAGTGATRVEMQAAGGFWAGATAIDDAPFSVTPAGELKATGITELGTAGVSVGGKTQNVAIKGPDIWENTYDGDEGALFINRLGCNGGDSYARRTEICNGFGYALMAFRGPNDTDDTDDFNGTINVYAEHFIFTQHPPASTVGLADGEVYRDGAFLKINLI